VLLAACLEFNALITNSTRLSSSQQKAGRKEEKGPEKLNCKYYYNTPGERKKERKGREGKKTYHTSAIR